MESGARRLGRRVAGWSDVARNLLLAVAVAASAHGMALACSTPTLNWLGWVTLLPLFFAIRVLSPLTAAAAGAFWGVCLFGDAVIWGGLPLRTDLTGFALLALIPGVYAYLGAWLTRRVGFSPYLLALGWIGVEFALHPLGLRNGLLAATQGDGLALRVVGSFAGYVLVAFFVAYINAMLVGVLSNVRLVAAATRLLRSGSSGIRRLIAQDPAIQLLDFIRQAQPRGPPLRLAAVPASWR